MKLRKHWVELSLPFCFRSSLLSQTYDDLLDKIDINCKELMEGNEEVIKTLKRWKYEVGEIERTIQNAEDRCLAIKELFGFNKKNTTQEELEYPIAYGALVYKNFVQVMFMLSAFYRSHNEYCIGVSGSADPSFLESMLQFGNCFTNVHILQRPPIDWGVFEIINSNWECVETLAKSRTKWMYYQQLSGVDVPLKTNLEMVKILKRWNETVNIDFKRFPIKRLRGGKKTGQARKLLNFLNGSYVPDEAFWATLTGNYKEFPVPGGTDALEWIKYRIHYRLNRTAYVARYEEADPSQPLMNYYLARYQIWRKAWCKGKHYRGSCAFGVDDVADVLKQPHLIAHKFHFDFQPAGFFCALKEIRAREAKPLKINLDLYAEIPQVELSAGVPYEKLTHRLWMINKHWIENLTYFSMPFIDTVDTH